MAALDGITVRRSSTAQQVADGLAQLLLSGAFAPGHRLRESVLAAELGLSRNTVREAVRILESTGLVGHEVNRGAIVITPTPAKIEALYDARDRLEAAAARTPASADQLRQVEASYAALTKVSATRDLSQIVEADLAFHAAIVSILGSSRIDAFYAGLAKELRFYLMVLAIEDHQFEDPSTLLAEHGAILAAIRSGDADEAVAAVRSHIENDAARLQRILAERS